MSAKHDLKHSILSVLKHNKDGSFATQANRKTQLLKLVEDLLANGYYLRNIHQLKAKHIYRMLESWQAKNLSAGTLKNRMANIRWLCSKINKSNIVPNSNNTLNIEKRQYVTNQDKSMQLSETILEKITDPSVKLSLQLQQAFGLRKEEAIKIKIHEAVKGNSLMLKGAWCKNGRLRTLEIKTPQQWKIIEACKTHIGKTNCSLIPKNKNYYQQMKTYENELAKAGIHKAHGLRHAYAQQLYLELTGWKAPAKGGPTKKQLSAEQQVIDQHARQIISANLGHERIRVVSVYIGQ